MDILCCMYDHHYLLNETILNNNLRINAGSPQHPLRNTAIDYLVSLNNTNIVTRHEYFFKPQNSASKHFFGEWDFVMATALTIWENMHLTSFFHYFTAVLQSSGPILNDTFSNTVTPNGTIFNFKLIFWQELPENFTSYHANMIAKEQRFANNFFLKRFSRLPVVWWFFAL